MHVLARGLELRVWHKAEQVVFSCYLDVLLSSSSLRAASLLDSLFE